MSSQSKVQELLHAAKAASGDSIRTIARKGGLSHGTVSNALHGVDRTHPIPDDTLDKLAQGFGIPAPRLRAAHLADRGLVPAEDPEPTTPGPDEVVRAVLADPLLLPEAKQHLINQYGLLLRIQGSPAQQQAETTAAHIEDLRKHRDAKRGAKRPR